MTLFGAALLFWLLPTLAFLAIAVILYPAMVLARKFRHPLHRHPDARNKTIVRSTDS